MSLPTARPLNRGRNLMRYPILRMLTVPAMVLALLATGCDDSPTELESDQAAIESIISEELDFFTAELYGDAADEDPDNPLGRTLAEIEPWRYYRQILDVDREIVIEVDETAEPVIADVTWTAVFDGVFHVVDTSATTYDKDFTDTAVRYAQFTKTGADSDRHRGWTMTSISGTEMVSSPVTVQIDSVHITSSGGLDVTFYSVSELIAREEVLTFTAGDTIMIEVATGDPTDVIIMHYPSFLQGLHQNRHHVRRMFRNNEDGTFTSGFVAHRYTYVRGQWREQLGPRHFTIDVLSDGTIYTDDEPYDAMGWGIVYRVAPE